MESSDTPPIVSIRGAVKTFGPVVALADGQIDLRAGEIHALAGENGAGKSTLVKIMAGLYQRDAGDFEVEGTQVHFGSVADSRCVPLKPAPATWVTPPSGATSDRRTNQFAWGASADSFRTALGNPRISTSFSRGLVS